MTKKFLKDCARTGLIGVYEIMPLEEMIKLLTDTREYLLTAEWRNLVIEVDYNDCDVGVVIRGERPETDEEEERRLRAELLHQQALERQKENKKKEARERAANERKEYERLKAKFEGKP